MTFNTSFFNPKKSPNRIPIAPILFLTLYFFNSPALGGTEYQHTPSGPTGGSITWKHLITPGPSTHGPDNPYGISSDQHHTINMGGYSCRTTFYTDSLNPSVVITLPSGGFRSVVCTVHLIGADCREGRIDSASISFSQPHPAPYTIEGFAQKACPVFIGKIKEQSITDR